MNNEEFGFHIGFHNRVNINGHRLNPIGNIAHFDSNGRLFYHFVLLCNRCGQEKAIRGRFPKSHSQEERISIVKLIILGHFNRMSCPP